MNSVEPVAIGRCVSVWPFRFTVPLANPMRWLPRTDASSESVTFVKRRSRCVLPPVRTRRTAP